MSETHILIRLWMYFPRNRKFGGWGVVPPPPGYDRAKAGPDRFLDSSFILPNEYEGLSLLGVKRSGRLAYHFPLSSAEGKERDRSYTPQYVDSSVLPNYNAEHTLTSTCK
jgi:hypothetical protein